MNSKEWFDERGVFVTHLDSDLAIKDVPGITLTNPKFKLGDEVTSVITGLPTIGKVIGIQCGWLTFLEHVFYNKKDPNSISVDNHAWTKYFGREWTEKCVYIVMFNSGPQRPLSYTEWLEVPNLPEYLKNEEAYKNQIPERSFASYAEDDLQLVEDI